MDMLEQEWGPCPIQKTASPYLLKMESRNPKRSALFLSFNTGETRYSGGRLRDVEKLLVLLLTKIETEIKATKSKDSVKMEIFNEFWVDASSGEIVVGVSGQVDAKDPETLFNGSLVGLIRYVSGQLGLKVVLLDNRA